MKENSNHSIITTLTSYYKTRTNQLSLVLYFTLINFTPLRIRGWFYFDLTRQLSTFFRSHTQSMHIGDITDSATVSSEAISWSETFIVWCISYLESIIRHHPHSFCSPHVSRKPSIFAISQLVCMHKMSSLTNVFSTFRQFLHSLCFLQFLIDVPPQLERNPIPVMTHSSSSDWFGQCLMSCLFGIHLKIV